MYIYLLSFMLLSFSTNTYAADTKADADCKNNFVFLEMDYVSLLKEYDTYRSMANSYGSNCLATFKYSYKYKNKSSKLINASNFINPFLYLSLSKLKYFSALKGKQDISEKNLKTFAKLALKNFNDPKNSFLYISEANEILSNS